MSNSPWNLLSKESVTDILNQVNNSSSTVKTVHKSKDPSVNGSFDEPVRKGRKPEVDKAHPAVLKCRELYLLGTPLHRVSIEAGVEYSILSRWYDKGWLDIQKKKRVKA